jgi:hypothetical protein
MLSSAVAVAAPASGQGLSVQDLPLLQTEASEEKKRKHDAVDVTRETEEWRDEFAYADTLVES